MSKPKSKRKNNQEKLKETYARRHMTLMKAEKAKSAKLQVSSFVNGYILGIGKNFETLTPEEFQGYYEDAMSKADQLHKDNMKDIKDAE